MIETEEEILRILNTGEIEVKGEFIWGSNYTFLVQLRSDTAHFQAVYKPTRGERPLWDFPAASLAKREVAAYLVSRELGWDLVPPTTYRRKGPLGAGSLQWFVEHDPSYHYFNFTSDDLNRLRPTALFDILINNADRKGSHILKDPSDHLWLIDHGVCFHVDDKLRTVIWDFVGEPIPGDLCESLSRFSLKLGQLQGEGNEIVSELAIYISQAEIRAMQRRADHLIASGRFPIADPYRQPFPWPQI